MQGVILSVAEPVGFPAISIELHKGKVKKHSLNYAFCNYPVAKRKISIFLTKSLFIFVTDNNVVRSGRR